MNLKTSLFLLSLTRPSHPKGIMKKNTFISLQLPVHQNVLPDHEYHKSCQY